MAVSCCAARCESPAPCEVLCAASATPAMFLAISLAPRAASVTLRDISLVVAFCSSTAEAMEFKMSLTWVMIFVIVPIVIPPLLVRVADARWVSVLVLLTLQSSFLLPPFGYALMMVRGVLREQVAFGPFLRALAPYLAAQWLLLVVVLCFPQLTHVGQSAETSTRAPAAQMSDEEFNKKLREMIKIPEPGELGDPNQR